MNYIRKGTEVIVNIPEEYQQSYGLAVAKYQGQKMRVERCVHVGRQSQVYYELEDAVSDYCIPFGFLKEWLMPALAR